jgi:hypothetical protein
LNDDPLEAEDDPSSKLLGLADVLLSTNGFDLRSVAQRVVNTYNNYYRYGDENTEPFQYANKDGVVIKSPMLTTLSVERHIRSDPLLSGKVYDQLSIATQNALIERLNEKIGSSEFIDHKDVKALHNTIECRLRAMKHISDRYRPQAKSI